MGARNALEIARLGRLSPRQGTPYDVVHRAEHYRLRHYGSGHEKTPGRALLLVPPLMLTAEIYDVAPDISAAAVLTGHGIDTWVVDFGAPEQEAGGMARTLDDHVKAVADAVEQVRVATGLPVHLAGYSQGGMFAYQAAAYRKSDGIASIITFGSPVDIHRNIPGLSTDFTARLIQAWRPLVEPPLRMIDGLPGVLTSTGFKFFSIRKEIGQIAEFLRSLHDRRALEKREARRRFLAGEGFVAWPGPALMQFIDEFIVHNRMLSGGFVIDGRTITLADIRSPVLYFVGTRDEMARPASVRAVCDAIPTADLYEVQVRSGHFGLVVGSTAMRDSWPTVIEWVKWQNGSGGRPARLPVSVKPDAIDIEDAAFDAELDFDLFYDVIQRTASSALEWLSDSVEDVGDAIDQARYQLPRLLRLRRIHDETRVSSARTLELQARQNGERTFFLYQGRAVTYADANRRVDYVVRGLVACGVRPGNHVGVIMRSRPSFLSIVTALNRLGAVSVLFTPDAEPENLRRAISVGHLQFLVADPENAELARDVFHQAVLVLGGGPDRPVAEGALDMEAIDPEAVELPAWYRPNPGRAEDLSTIFVTVTDQGSRAARITNRRWAFSAYGAAAACTLTPKDTVYCCLPLHHPAGLLVSAGGAAVGGARLALATRFEPRVFWEEVRRYGASVVFYAGEMCRALVDAPTAAGERNHPLRLFAGSGMRADIWRRLVDRFGAGVLEFYASTEVSLVLANAAGKKVGALGRPLPGSREPFLGAFDVERSSFIRDQQGKVVEPPPEQPGVLLARIEPMPLAPLDDRPVTERPPGPFNLPRLIRGVLQEGDTWFVTGDLIRRDADGDYWFVDRLKDVIMTDAGPILSRPLEDALYQLGDITGVAVYGAPHPKNAAEVCVAAILPCHRTFDLSRVSAALRRTEPALPIPAFVRLVKSIPMTEGFRPLKETLRRQGLPADGTTFRWDEQRQQYESTAPDRSLPH